LSFLEKAFVTATLSVVFILALSQGMPLGPHSSFPAVILSGVFWLAASVIPVWIPSARELPIVSATFNTVAAGAAVFAGLAVLPRCLAPVWFLGWLHLSAIGSFCPPS
jgi:hypothetical protein